APSDIITPRSRASGSSLNITIRDVVWVGRICALHVEPWVGVYAPDREGRLSLCETIRMTERLCHLNQADPPAFSVQLHGRHREECPWRGATYRDWGGPINCNTCGAKVCFGRTTADDYFRCYCGAEGPLRASSHPEIGFRPTLRKFQ